MCHNYGPAIVLISQESVCTVCLKFSHFTLYAFCSRHYLSFQGPAQAQNLRDSLAEAKSDIVVKVSFFSYSFVVFPHSKWCIGELSCS